MTRGRPPRSEHERADRRRQLVRAAMAAVRLGGADISVDDLAEAGGVSKPVLYDEFGGKLGLVDAVATALAEEFDKQVMARLAEHGAVDFGAVVRVTMEALIDLIADEPGIYAFVVRSIRTSDRGFLDNALVRAIHDRAIVLMRLVAADLTPDAVEVLTDGLFGFVFAAVESWLPRRQPPQPEFVETMARVIEEGIRVVTTRA